MKKRGSISPSRRMKTSQERSQHNKSKSDAAARAKRQRLDRPKRNIA